MNLIEKLAAIAPEHEERFALLKNETQLEAFLAETGADLTEEEKKAAVAYIKIRKAEPPKDGIEELADEELDNVVGGHGGLCHDKNGREVVALISVCVHGEKDDTGGRRYCGSDDRKRFSNSYACQYLSYEKGIWYCNYPQHLKT